jgi:hypothetical protein
MKKDDALDKLDRAGNQINSLYGSAWNTALNPTRYGWGSSLLGIVSIPVLSAASIGHMVGSAVVRQVNDETFEKFTTLPQPTDDKKKDEPGDKK